MRHMKTTAEGALVSAGRSDIRMLRIHSCWDLQKYDVIEARHGHETYHEGVVDTVMPEKGLFWATSQDGQRCIVEFAECQVYLRSRSWDPKTLQRPPADVTWGQTDTSPVYRVHPTLR
jgi:hypothetical protein